MENNNSYLCSFEIIKKIAIQFLQANNLIKLKNKIVILEVKPKLNSAHLACNLFFLLNFENKKERFFEFLKKRNYNNYFTKIEVKNNFLNFWFNPSYLNKIINVILEKKLNFQKVVKLNPKKINIEIVSANPSGLLHIGHVRNGCLGTSLGKIFAHLGYLVTFEYYVNDAGNQIDLLASSIYYHYLKIINPNLEIKFSDNFYKGEIYLKLAQKIINEYQFKFQNSTIISEKIQDLKIKEFFKEYAKNYFLENIKKELKKLKIKIDFFRHESSVYKNNKILFILKRYQETNNLDLKNNATFLKTTKLNDEKNRVLIKENKTYTYLLPDIASHYERISNLKTTKLFLNFVGADHHDYAKRMIMSLKLLDFNLTMPIYKIIQMVKLKTNQKIVKISKRKGNIIYFKDLNKFLSVSTINYMMVSKVSSAQLILDLNLLKSQSSNNPIFYINYACARIFQLFKVAKIDFKTINFKNFNFADLNNEFETRIITKLHLFNFYLQKAALSLEPSWICNYLYDLVKLFHIYYSKVKILNQENLKTTNKKLLLIKAIQYVIKICLKLINVSYIQKMY